MSKKNEKTRILEKTRKIIKGRTIRDILTLFEAEEEKGERKKLDKLEKKRT